MEEHPKSESTQLRFAKRCVTLHVYLLHFISTRYQVGHVNSAQKSAYNRTV